MRAQCFSQAKSAPSATRKVLKTPHPASNPSCPANRLASPASRMMPLWRKWRCMDINSLFHHYVAFCLEFCSLFPFGIGRCLTHGVARFKEDPQVFDGAGKIPIGFHFVGRFVIVVLGVVIALLFAVVG